MEIVGRDQRDEEERKLRKINIRQQIMEYIKQSERTRTSACHSGPRIRRLEIESHHDIGNTDLSISSKEVITESCPQSQRNGRNFVKRNVLLAHNLFSKLTEEEQNHVEQILRDDSYNVRI